MKNKESVILPIIALILTIVIMAFFVFYNNSNTQVNPSSREGFYESKLSLEKLSEISSCPLTENKDDFAKCLTEKGWTMYGAVWCSHCQDQKKLFGDSFQYINYVECPDNTALCLAEGINGYPTWKVKK